MASKDPKSGNLDRVQIVKGWLDASGKQHEKIYDVVWSGDRKIGADGKLPAVGNSVDLQTATYTNGIGAAQLATGWTDPDFKPDERAFYYARVLEIPTPRWNTYDAVREKMAPLTEGAGDHPGARLEFADLVYACELIQECRRYRLDHRENPKSAGRMIHSLVGIPMLVDIATYLPCTPALVIAHVNSPQLLLHVAKPLVTFVAIEPPQFPVTWTDGT